ncbi:MAG: protein phosphatase [Aureliella sp.]
MISIHPKLLWLGHALDAREPRALYDAGIKAVVDLAFAESPAVLPRDFIYCRFPLLDGGGNEPAVLRLALQTIVNLLDARLPTLVACSVGMSRSPTLAAFALSAHLHSKPKEVVLRISELKSLEINGALWNDVSTVYQSLELGKNSFSSNRE